MSEPLNLNADQGATLNFIVNWQQATPTTTWTAATDYEVGAVVNPTASTGFIYIAGSGGGLSDATEPTWPIIVSDTVVDGSITWTCTNPSVQPVDITNYTAIMQVRSAAGATDLEASVTTTSSPAGVIILGGINGSINVTITGETTYGFTNTIYAYDLFLVSPEDVRTMVVDGKIKVNLAVTVVP